MSFKSRHFGFIVFENQSFNTSIVNFNSPENYSAREVDFSRAKQHLLADKTLSCLKMQHVLV